MARAGHQVVGVDVRESVVERLRNGDIHIADEDGLVEVAQTVLRSGALFRCRPHLWRPTRLSSAFQLQ